MEEHFIYLFIFEEVQSYHRQSVSISQGSDRDCPAVTSHMGSQQTLTGLIIHLAQRCSKESEFSIQRRC